MPELDTLRGVAVLMVVFYHGLFWSSDPGSKHGLTRVLLLATQPGWLGVHLFFVLSGFLITGILVDSQQRNDYYRRFYKRRALRILPAYFGLLAVLLLCGYIQWPFALLSFGFLANLATLFGIPLQYGPLWSLAVEEHFYLLWPTAVRHCRRMTLWGIAIGLIVLSPIVRLIAFETDVMTAGLYGYTWFMCDGLAMGAAIALLVRTPGISRRSVAILSAVTAAIAFMGLAGGARFGILTRARPLGAALQYTPWLLLFASAMMAMLLLGSGNRFRALLHSRVMAFFGDISYGLYLIHVFVFDMVDRAAAAVPGLHAFWKITGLGVLTRFSIGFAVSVAVATISRKWFEEWFLSKGRSMAGQRPRVAAVTQ